MPAEAHYQQHNTKRSRSSSDCSLLHSLASIRLDSSDNKMTPPQSRRHSTNGNCKVVSGTRVCGVSSRRATMGDPPADEDRPCPKSVHSSNNNILDLKVPPAPPLPFDTRKPSSAKNKDVKNHQKKELKSYCSRRDDYTLGEKARSASHMMDAIHPQSVYQLKNYDFAFVKRSNGSWTYAMLAHRSRGISIEEEHMVFVLDEKGSRKVIDEKDWARFIRCLAESEDQITVERATGRDH
eukprot:scaffold1462_cov64-Cyclotella_meneghiniana.AAC.1